MINSAITTTSTLPRPALPPIAPRGPRGGSAIGAIDALFDLSAGRRDPFSTLGRLSGEELESFLQMTADLLRAGIVGIETLEVEGQPRETFVSTRAAAPDLRGAPPYVDRRPPGRAFDVRV